MIGEGGDDESLSAPLAVAACVAMALLYVSILSAPVILRLPPPSSFASFMIRRFVCASISTATSLVLTAVILPRKSWEVADLFRLYGIRADHLWQAVVYPLLLTSLMYAGSLLLKLLLLLGSWRGEDHGGCLSIYGITSFIQTIPARVLSVASSVSVWRYFVVAPVTEELVFRACMIPLLLCGGFGIYRAIFLCPILFSLAHLNQFMEVYIRNNFSFLKASMITGLRLGYTVVFGSYASFLFIRTGHLVAPLIAHIFCNFMGLPTLFAQGKGAVSAAFLTGMVMFMLLLFPLTKPDLFNNRTNDCQCWHSYCSWN